MSVEKMIVVAARVAVRLGVRGSEELIAMAEGDAGCRSRGKKESQRIGASWLKHVAWARWMRLSDGIDVTFRLRGEVKRP